MKIIQLDSKSTKKDWDYFFEVPKSIYSDSSVWVEESSENIKNELVSILGGKTRYKAWPLIVMDYNYPCARGVAIIPPGNGSIGWIGYFEVHKDYLKEGKAIISELERILKQAGVKKITAPKTNNLYAGLQISDYKYPQTILTPHNPSYYKNVFQNSGYKVSQKLNCFFFTKKTVKRIGSSDEFVLRKFNRDNLEKEIEIFHGLQKKIFEGHDGYVSRTIEEERDLIYGLLPLIDDDLIVIAQNNDGKTIGLLICIPDHNQMVKEGKIDRARIISIGVHPEYLRKGIGKQMGKRLMDILITKKYESVEASWILKTNMPPQLMAKLYGAKKGRTFALFEKKLD